VQQLDIFAQMQQEIIQQNTAVIKAVHETNDTERLYYSISEVAKMFNINASNLRFWEKEFPQLKLKKNAKGDRFFNKENIEFIGTIFYLTKERKFTLEGARTYLKKVKKTTNNEKDLVQQLTELKTFLQELKNNLQ
jgi:DNA-binding transcriptional MerR regulator